MAVTHKSVGNLTATASQQDILAADTTNGTFVVSVDTSAMVAGDIMELRIFQKINNNTERLADYAVYAGVQSTFIKRSLPVPSFGSATDTIRVTLVQTVGTGRIYPYRVVSVG
jgi:hypothetical protein